jgi:hypothetical protein
MPIPTCFGQAGPVLRAQSPLHTAPVQTPSLQVRLQGWAFGRLVAFDPMVVDLRLALAALVTRSLIEVADALVRHVMSRAWRGARFGKTITAAATMVAAAGR